MVDLSLSAPAVRRRPAVSAGERSRADAWIRQVCAGGAIAYRMFATAAYCVPWLVVPGTQQLAVGAVVLAMLAYNVLAIRIVLDPSGFAGATRWPTMALDLALAVLVVACVGLLLNRGGLQGPVGWSMMSGTVALWTVVHGRKVGMLLVLASLPVAVVLAGLTTTWDLAVMWPQVASRVGQCGIGVVGVLLLQPAVWSYARTWRQAGVREGSESERARTQRIVHDTTIQTLEAIALLASSAGTQESAAVLRRVGALAAREAHGLRSRLVTPAAEHSDLDAHEADAHPVDAGLLDGLREVVCDARATGLDVVLVDEECEAAHLGVVASCALVGAVGEAMTNVVKHSGARRAVVRVTTAQGVEVTVRDDGKGFDPLTAREGFGLRESIRARMAEVGGSACIESSPGDGVLVRLHLPVDRMA